MRSLLVIGAVLLLGCGQTSPAADGGGGAVAGGGGDPGGGGSGGSPAMNLGSIEGTVQDLSGTPHVDAPIQLCSADSCILGKSDADGRWLYQDVVPGPYHMDVRPLPAANANYAPVVFHVDIGDSEHVVVDTPSVPPDTGNGIKLTGGQVVVDIDATLSITVDPANLTLPLGVVEAYLAGTRIPDTAYPTMATHTPLSGTIVAMWAFNPMGTTASTPLPLSIANDLGLAADTPLEIHVLDQLDGYFSLASTAAVSSDGATIVVDSGIQQLSWLAVVQP